MRVCVYTTIFGGYDPLREQQAQSVPTDFICFTESNDLAPCKPWSIVVNQDRAELSPRMRAKYFKVLSHRVFPGGLLSPEIAPNGKGRGNEPYDHLIFIDSSVQIQRADFVEMIISHIPRAGWAMLVHPERDCIYTEIDESLRAWPKKYAPFRIVEQVQDYRNEGYPEKNGLFAATIIGRKADDPALPELHDAWWKEIVEYSPQDQISLPVVLWRSKKSPVVPIQVYLWKNEFFRWIRHARDD